MTQEEFLEKLAPCLERGDLDACVEEAAKLAKQMRIGAVELLDLSYSQGVYEKHSLVYVLALAAAKDLDEPNKAVAYYNAANAADSIGDLKRSEECYIKSIEINPNDANAHTNFAFLLNEVGRKTEAEEHYKIALQLNPNYALAHKNYAFLLYEQGRKIEAEEHYKIALQIDPNFIEAHFGYAVLLDELGRGTEAEVHYKKAVELNPNFIEGFNNYADFLRKSARFSEAETQARMALQLEPNYPYALATLGDILNDEEYLEDAIKIYHKALESSASKNLSLESEIHNNLGAAYAKLKQEANAKEEFKKAKILDPMNVKAVRNLRALSRAEIVTPEISRTQIYISAIPALLFIASFVWFYCGKLSDTMFVAQSTFSMTVVLFVLFSNQLVRFKMGTLELEISERSLESRRIAAILKMER